VSIFTRKGVPLRKLVDSAWLRNNLGKGLRILDVRVPFGQTTAGYPWGHIPGAIPFNPDAFFTLPPRRSVRPLKDLRRELEPLGFGNDTRFVIYDESTRTSSTLTYWMLKTLGFREVAVLNGGWQGWLSSGAPIEDTLPAFPTPAFEPSPVESLIATTEFILQNMELIKLIDTRTEREFAGGHIPGAVHWDWTKDIERDSGSEWLRPEEELLSLAESLGIDEADEIVCYCNSGIQASHVCFVLDLLGFRNLRLYIGSWDEWRSRNLPLESGGVESVHR